MAHPPRRAARFWPADPDGIAVRVQRYCADQGIPEKVEDPAIIANVVTLAFEGLTTPSRKP
jgi:hypothetical protein